MTSELPARIAEAAAALAAPGSALRRDALDDLVADGSLSPPMAAWALDTTAARFTPAALAALARDELAGAPVQLVLAASVPTAPLRAVALALLRGAARVYVRPSRRQPRFARTVLRALALPTLDLAEDVPHPKARHVIAYGRDETLRALAGRVPPGVRFEGHGHGFGVGYVPRDAPRDRAARSFALDVAAYDQRGCLSPQAIFVAGDAEGFARALHAALDALTTALPRGPLDAAEAARVLQWQGTTAVTASLLLRGRAHAVALLPAPVLVPSPGARQVTVVPAAGTGAVAAALAPFRAYLTCVGVAGPHDEGLLPAGPRVRVVPAGTMQDPALDGLEDPRPPAVFPRGRA